MSSQILRLTLKSSTLRKSHKLRFSKAEQKERDLFNGSVTQKSIMVILLKLRKALSLDVADITTDESEPGVSVK